MRPPCSDMALATPPRLPSLCVMMSVVGLRATPDEALERLAQGFPEAGRMFFANIRARF